MDHYVMMLFKYDNATVRLYGITRYGPVPALGGAGLGGALPDWSAALHPTKPAPYPAPSHMHTHRHTRTHSRRPDCYWTLR